jgi:hypothetical protein
MGRLAATPVDDLSARGQIAPTCGVCDTGEAAWSRGTQIARSINFIRVSICVRKAA